MLTYTSNVCEKICILRVRVCMYMQGGKGVQLKRSAVDRGSLWRAARFRCATLCQLYSHIPNLCTCTYVRNGRSWLNKGCMDNIVCAALHSSSTFVTASRYIFVGITTFAISFIPFRPLSLIFLYRTFVSLSSSLFISSPFIFFHFFFFFIFLRGRRSSPNQWFYFGGKSVCRATILYQWNVRFSLLHACNNVQEKYLLFSLQTLTCFISSYLDVYAFWS